VGCEKVDFLSARSNEGPFEHGNGPSGYMKLMNFMTS